MAGIAALTLEQRYLATLGLAVSAMLATTAWFNTAVNINQRIATAAARWQTTTGGIVALSPAFATDFKRARAVMLPQRITTAVFGTSTVAAVNSTALGPGFFNFASPAGLPGTTYAVALGNIQRHPDIRHIVVGFDWAIGYAFFPLPKPKSLLERAQASLTTPDIVSLFYVDFQITTCRDRPHLAYGFEAPNCPGVDLDGSSTFNHTTPLTEEQARTVTPDYYTKPISEALGRPHHEYLAALAQIAATMKLRNGAMTIYMPPLLPGIDRAASVNTYVRVFKSMMQKHAQAIGASLLDGGPSETFGCTYADFIDGHHALHSCHRKILKAALPQP